MVWLAPEKSIEQIDFGILSAEEIIRQSVAEITHNDIFENKLPKIGGLADPRLGCVDKNTRCYTCHGTINECPGHFGHIVLNTPLYHIGFIKRVKKILECICPKCARLRLLPTDPRYQKLLHVKDKFDYAWLCTKSKFACEYPGCETQCPPIRRKAITLY